MLRSTVILFDGDSSSSASSAVPGSTEVASRHPRTLRWATGSCSYRRALGAESGCSGLSPTDPPSVSRRPGLRFAARIAPLAWIALLAIAAYSNTFHAMFVFDDRPSIVDYEAIRDLSAFLRIGARASPEPVRGLSFLRAELPARRPRSRRLPRGQPRHPPRERVPRLLPGAPGVPNAAPPDLGGRSFIGRDRLPGCHALRGASHSDRSRDVCRPAAHVARDDLLSRSRHPVRELQAAATGGRAVARRAPLRAPPRDGAPRHEDEGDLADPSVRARPRRGRLVRAPAEAPPARARTAARDDARHPADGDRHRADADGGLLLAARRCLAGTDCHLTMGLRDDADRGASRRTCGCSSCP